MKTLGLKALVTTLAAVLFVGLTSTSAQAAAEGEQALWIGGAAGVIVPTKSNSTARTAFGVTAGAKIGTEMGLGAYYFTSAKDEGGTQGKFDLNFYGVEGTYHFEGEAKGAYFGVRLGITKIDFGTTPTASVSPFHVGVIGGYNHFLTDNFSLGGDVAAYSVSKGDTTISGLTVSSEAFSALSFLATLKLWL